MYKLHTFFLMFMLAFSVGWATEKSDVLNPGITGITGTSFSNFSGKTAASGAVYAGNCAGGYSSIQLRSSNSNSGIVTTASGGKVKSVTVVWNSHTSSGGTLNVYGKNTSYTAASELYNTSSQGTLLGTIVNGTSTSLTIDGDYEYIGFRSLNGMLYLTSVTIVWEAEGGDPVEPKWYRKVTSTSDLVAGKKCVVMHENDTTLVGMGALNSNGYGVPVTDLAIVNGRVDIAGTSVAEFTLGGTLNAWTFKNSDNRYLGMGSSSADYFGTSSTPNYADLKWTVANSGTIQNNSNTTKFIRCNSSNLFGLFGMGTVAHLYVEDLEDCAAPVFSPDGGIFTGTADVTIASATDGATIYYTTDGSDPVVGGISIENGGKVTLTESCTVKAMAVKSGLDNSPVVTSNPYTINTAGGGGSGDFGLLTDASLLHPGDEIIFVNAAAAGDAYAMSIKQNSSNRGSTIVTVGDDLTVAATENTEVFTLEGSSEGWYFKTHDGRYIYAASNTANHLKTQDEANDNAKATIAISETRTAIVTFQGEYERNILRFNPDSKIYSCYLSTSPNPEPYIYYRRAASPDPSLSVSPATLSITDTSEAGARNASFTVNGSQLTGDVAITIDPSHSSNFTVNPGSIAPVSGEVHDQTVGVAYNGYALSATGLVNAASSGLTEQVNVNYLYDGPIYIVGDVNGLGWTPVTGVEMEKEDGIYTKTITANAGNTGYAWLYFTKSLNADNYDNLGDNRFGPRCNNNDGEPEFGQQWFFDESSLNGIYCDLDTVYKLNTIKLVPGTYTITINPALNQFKIERYAINVTITPADGTTFTGPTISGTITASPAGVIEWRTDNGAWQTYTDGFSATVNEEGGSVTIYARSTSNGVTSETVSATYTRVADPTTIATLAEIESSEEAVEPIVGNKKVQVSDELIGVWAVVNPELGVNKLWAKDQGNASIDKTFKTDEQADYVKDIWGFETKDEWDQSNWVVLDFSALDGESAFNYASRRLQGGSVKGYYTDDMNYTIKLTNVPDKVDENDVTGYPGYNCDYQETSPGVVYYYNHYTPANFLLENLNEPYGDGAEAGQASVVEGKKLFLMNPKVQEVAQVWAVWMGNGRFDVLATDGTSINGYDLSGAFDVLTWDYNRLRGGDDEAEYGSPLSMNPDALDYGEPYLFHAIVTRTNDDYGHQHRAPGAEPSAAFGIMPIDLPAGHPNPTSVKTVKSAKEVVEVTYYNVMGERSECPFKGVNIVVTRYSDGSSHAAKVLRF